MLVRIVVAFALSGALALAPLAAVAHEGHDHGKKAKKEKKTKAKQAAIIFRLARPAA